MRVRIFNILYDYINKNTFLNLVLKHEKEHVNKITMMVYGIVEKKLYLEFLIEKTVNRKIDLKTKIILMMAIYEKLFLERDDYIICNEYIELTKKVNPKAKKYVTYYLHNLLPNEFIMPNYKDELTNEAIFLSIPKYPLSLLKEQYPDFYIEIINTRKRNYVRKINDLLNPNDFTNFEFSDLYYANKPVVKTKDFKEGNIIIQDFGSYLVTKFVNPQKNDEILDLCAAPGNKTMHMYKYCHNITANEINLKRYQLMEKNFENQNYKIKITNIDATNEKEIKKTFNKKYDKILLDVPCSGLGVIASKPEIRYNINEIEVRKLIKIQKKIFDNAINLLKLNGEIIYSTCSLNEKENEEQINYFCEKYNLEVIKDKKFEKYMMEVDQGYKLLPFDFQTDGFFITKLKRKENNE